MLTNLEEGTDLTESVNRALRAMRFTIHTRLKRTPFELHHGRKPRTELTNIPKDGKHIYRIGQKYLFQQTNRRSQSVWAVMRMARSRTTWSWQSSKPKKNKPMKAQSHRRRKIRLATLLNSQKKIITKNH